MELEIDKLELASEKGVDYSNLRDLLKAGKWQEADEETRKVMLKAANCESDDWYDDSLNNFPCPDLKTIDQLWVTASNGHFGFNVQKKIWEKCGSPMSFNDDWKKFVYAVGWCDDNNYYGSLNNYSILKYSPPPEGNSPSGELPMLGYLNVWYEEGIGWDWWWGGVFPLLAQRLADCSAP